MVNYVNRELNTEAHNVAALAKHLGFRCWQGNVPLNLFPVPSCNFSVGHVQAISVV